MAVVPIETQGQIMDQPISNPNVMHSVLADLNFQVRWGTATVCSLVTLVGLSEALISLSCQLEQLMLHPNHRGQGHHLKHLE
jgi:hypothetical protein